MLVLVLVLLLVVVVEVVIVVLVVLVVLVVIVGIVVIVVIIVIVVIVVVRMCMLPSPRHFPDARHPARACAGTESGTESSAAGQVFADVSDSSIMRPSVI